MCGFLCHHIKIGSGLSAQSIKTVFVFLICVTLTLLALMSDTSLTFTVCFVTYNAAHGKSNRIYHKKRIY